MCWCDPRKRTPYCGGDRCVPSVGWNTPAVNEERNLTVGEKRVRCSFNPSSNKIVDMIKTDTAWLIDFCEELKKLDPRLAALAQTAYEEAAMWAVKAATA